MVNHVVLGLTLTLSSALGLTTLLVAFLAGRYSHHWQLLFSSKKRLLRALGASHSPRRSHGNRPRVEHVDEAVNGRGDEDDSGFFALIGNTPLIKLHSLSRETACEIYVRSPSLVLYLLISYSLFLS